MKYVGATNSFIRWPFIIEGMLIGFVSAAFTIGIVGLLYNVLARKIVESDAFAKMNISLLGFTDMFNQIVLVYIILGMGIGIVGSVVSMRKYLKV